MAGTSTEIPPDSYFYNYFSLGLDFLFHPENNKVIKVLIHANIPGEVLFGRYNKCRWRIEQSDSSASVTSEDCVSYILCFYLRDSVTDASR